MSDLTYLINYTDRSIKADSITVYPNQIDSSTSLVMHGYGSVRYGEDIWKNMLHMMEHFCSWSTEPNNPTEGQLWYKASTKQLLLRTKDTTGAATWLNIIPSVGFDSSSSGGSSDGIASISKVNELLKSYVSMKGNPAIDPMSGILYLYNDSTWYDVNSKGEVIAKDTTTDLENAAATRTYVDVKVKTEIDNKVSFLTPVAGTSITPQAVMDALATLPATKHTVLFRSGDISYRTMGDALILRNQDNVVGGNAYPAINEAISKKYLDAVLSNSNNVVNKDNIFKVLSDNVNESTNDTPLVSKFGSTMTGELLLPTVTTLSNAKSAVTKEYVDGKLQLNVIPPTLGESSNVSFSKSPDGTIFVYGHAHKLIRSTTGTNWYYADISLPAGIQYMNTYYAVTVTEEIPGTNTVPSTYPQPHQFTDNVGGTLTHVSWPLMFSVYGKTTSSFSVCVYVPSGIDQKYIDSLSFNFVAIGR